VGQPASCSSVSTATLPLALARGKPPDSLAARIPGDAPRPPVDRVRARARAARRARPRPEAEARDAREAAEGAHHRPRRALVEGAPGHALRGMERDRTR